MRARKSARPRRAGCRATRGSALAPALFCTSRTCNSSLGAACTWRSTGTNRRSSFLAGKGDRHRVRMSKKRQIVPTLMWPREVFENDCLATPLRAVNTVAQGCGGPIGLADVIARGQLSGVLPCGGNQVLTSASAQKSLAHRRAPLKYPRRASRHRQSAVVLRLLGQPVALSGLCPDAVNSSAGRRRSSCLPLPAQVAELSPWSRTTPGQFNPLFVDGDVWHPCSGVEPFRRFVTPNVLVHRANSVV